MSTFDDQSAGPQWQRPGSVPGAEPTAAYAPLPPDESTAPYGPLAPYPPTVAQPRPRGLRAAAGGLALVLAGGVGGAALMHELRPASPAATAATSPGSTSPDVPQSPFTSPFGGGSSDGTTPGGSSDGSGSGTGSGPSDAASIATKVEGGIVDITTTLGYEGGQAAGTGMVLTSDGEVLTNNHVIAGATSISVTDVGNGETYAATVLGYDTAHDIAVLQLENASGLETVDTATTPVAVGAGVVGVGNAGGSGGEPEYAGGVVTALDQTITASDGSGGDAEQLTGLIETNAAIVAGYSGGPLVNQQGEVVGVDTAASANSRFGQSGEAYAIPIAQALRIADRIEAGDDSGSVHIGATAMLGVSVQQAGNGFGGSAGGAAVSDVLANGPAADAGLAAGDTITAIGGRAVSSADDIAAALRHRSPGSTVTVHYLDPNGVSRTARVRLAAGPAQ